MTYTFPAYQIGNHHRILAEALERVEMGLCPRLIVEMPPRHGKSEQVSRKFPAWFMGRNPTKQIISASYSGELASGFGRDVRNLVASTAFRNVFPHVTLSPDSKAKDNWNTNRGGVYSAVGVGGGSTGKGAHIMNIDDPFKDRAEAKSASRRDAVWDWYTSTAYTRLMPQSSVIVTMTRWHEDDLVGRLIDAEKNGGDKWERITLPAINEDGTALWPEAYDVERLRSIETAIGPMDWASLYLQAPTTLEGTLFHMEDCHTLEHTPVPVGGTVIRAWDLAATKQVGTRDPDYTVGLKMWKRPDGRFTVLDVVRLRGEPQDVERAIVNTAKQDGFSVKITLPQDPGQAGKAQVSHLATALVGYYMIATPETGDKETRAFPVATQLNAGNIDLAPGPWNREFIAELKGFPNASHDDQVDAMSRAFSQLEPSLLDRFKALM